jgi:transcriptional regulator with XRE-family HTH domain
MPLTKKQQQFITKVGKRIVALREERSMSQTELADRCGWDKQSLNRIENGAVNTTLKSLFIIAEALGVKVNEVINVD